MKLSLVLGHRGARFTTPENSLQSFKNAIRCGADGIELDVHLTKDNKLVVLHDSTLVRITGEKRLIKDLTLKEIKALDISHLVKNGPLKISWNVKVYRAPSGAYLVFVRDLAKEKENTYFVKMSDGSVVSLKRARFLRRPLEKPVAEKDIFIEAPLAKTHFEKTRIPEFSEVLNELTPSYINVEIKRGEQFYPGIIDSVVKEIEPFGFDKILFSSFNRPTLFEMKRRYPQLKINRLFEVPLNPVKASRGLDGINPLSLFIGRKGIQKVHSIRKTVFPWVVNKPVSMLKFFMFGADGIITDRPCFAAKIKKELESLLNEALS